ncbi:hypothetical protein [Pleomorphomonas sp. PLEO]|uniref:hypothetical protein n=1 Tax=Pleomorphomonas sp. PLEO TaxID=3239306 RepID=UPI00351F1557
MSVSVEFVPARGKHCRSIGRHMRAADAAECRAMGVFSPIGALRYSMRNSDATTALFDGRPAAMFGTRSLNVLAGVGCVWLLGTDDLLIHRKAFLRASVRGRHKLFERYSVLRNVVSTHNEASVRWLTWLGAEFAPDTIDVRGVPFVLFELRK